MAEKPKEAPKPKLAENKSQADQLKELDQPSGISDTADKVTDTMTPPLPPTQPMSPMPLGWGQNALPSMWNPLWQFAARSQNVSPITGGPQPNAPWLFQQGPMQLPPVPQGAGMPLPQ